MVRSLLGEGPMRRGIALGRLTRSWEHVVGPELAGETAPRGLEAGALLVAASSPGWGAKARFLAQDIRRRANQTLGEERVSSVKVIVSPDARKSLRHKGSGASGARDGTGGAGASE